MSWNYRVIRTEHGDESCFTIRQAHYKRRGQKIPSAWSKEAMAPLGTTIIELESDLKMMLAALEKPTLVIDGKKLKVDK